MRHTIGGREFDIEGEPIPGDHGEVRGIALRFHGTDGTKHEGAVMDHTYGFRPSNRPPDVQVVEEWAREKISHGWLNLGPVKVRTCPTCLAIVCVKTESSGSAVKCRNDHEVS